MLHSALRPYHRAPSIFRKPLTLASRPTALPPDNLDHRNSCPDNARRSGAAPKSRGARPAAATRRAVGSVAGHQQPECYSPPNLIDAKLNNAHLDSANLIRLNLSGATLSGAGISQAQLDQARGTDAKLPEGFTLKPCPAKQVAPPLNSKCDAISPFMASRAETWLARLQ